MLRRVLALARAGLAHHWAGGGVPIAPLAVHAAVAALAAGLVRDVLPPYAFALAMLSLSAAMLALPLLGDLAPLLRADPAEEWVAAQPVTRRQIRMGRSLVAGVVVLSLAAASIVPAAALAPGTWSLLERVALAAAGLGQALVVTALLLSLLSALGGRAESLLLGVQTLLFAAVVAAALVGLRHVPELARLHAPSDAPPWSAALPPAWFAAALAGSPASAAIASGGALALLVLAPSAPAASASRRSLLAVLLAPVARLATRAWVRPGERGSFDLVFRALPLERDVVLRTYPLVGIPLAFLAAGARTSGPERDALVALLLFAPPIWMPVLLVQVPASASHAARWLLDGAPTGPDAIHAGARKAIAVRFLLPLYAVLFGLAAWQSGFGFALRIVVPAALVGLIALRHLYAHCVRDLPLSRAPDDLLVEMHWTNVMVGVGVVQVACAIAAWKLLTSWPAALLAIAVLLAAELAAERPRRARAGAGSAA